ncbi:hypothetical protein [Candidatus Parabeggiatoa sp. HSG14]|uniref:hypothetical protein n=1 Tax=Candidatus Parabeggiatoa sp. HSG14 TaxID=3055593 RepID=UPI0025A79004|nr:hypothetical protein [Thiotrichales bacterium HSG14]
MNKTILWIFVLVIIPISVNVISDLIFEHLLNKDSETKVGNENFEPPAITKTPSIVDEVSKVGGKITVPQVPKIDKKTFEIPKIINKNTISVDFWLNEKGKTYFQNNQAVVVRYKVEAANEQSLFFSLFNRTSSDGVWSPLLENQLVKVGKLYSFSMVKVKSSQFVTQGLELRLQAGTEYFLAVVSAEANGNSELARKELIVEVGS